MHKLTKHAEKNKQYAAHVQREHRKGTERGLIDPVRLSLSLSLSLCRALAPFINQLRDLHQLHDDIDRKIHKRLSQLKIKGNDQAEFLRSISAIIHGNDRMHLTTNELREQEFAIELRDREVQRLAAIVFRYQYSRSCSESSAPAEGE